MQRGIMPLAGSARQWEIKGLATIWPAVFPGFELRLMR